MKARTGKLGVGIGASLLVMGAAWGTELPLKEVEIPRDPPALQRGAETVTQMCLYCHNLKYVRYRDLAAIGMDTAQLTKLRGDHALEDALLSPTTPEAAKNSYGAVPPDLSLMAKAREGGPRYIYTLLTSFYRTPDGSTDNHLFPGVRMPDVLNYGATPDPAQRATLEQTARDAAAFLAWAADPTEAKRHRLGIFVLGYLVVLTVLLYLLKRRVWGRLETLPLPLDRRRLEGDRRDADEID